MAYYCRNYTDADCYRRNLVDLSWLGSAVKRLEAGQFPRLRHASTTPVARLPEHEYQSSCTESRWNGEALAQSTSGIESHGSFAFFLRGDGMVFDGEEEN